MNALNDDPAAEGFLATTNEDTAKGIDVSGYISDVDVATNADSLTVTVETGDGPQCTAALRYRGDDHHLYAGGELETVRTASPIR